MLTEITVRAIVEEHGVKPMQIVLTRYIRSNQVIAIPKSVQLEHVKENAAAAAIELATEDFVRIERVFPAPHKKTYAPEHMSSR